MPAIVAWCAAAVALPLGYRGRDRLALIHFSSQPTTAAHKRTPHAPPMLVYDYDIASQLGVSPWHWTKPLRIWVKQPHYRNESGRARRPRASRCPSPSLCRHRTGIPATVLPALRRTTTSQRLARSAPHFHDGAHATAPRQPRVQARHARSGSSADHTEQARPEKIYHRTRAA